MAVNLLTRYLVHGDKYVKTYSALALLTMVMNSLMDYRDIVGVSWCNQITHPTQKTSHNTSHSTIESKFSILPLFTVGKLGVDSR